jgi:hypothetical protein
VLAGGLASLGVLLLDRLRRTGVRSLVEATLEVGEPTRSRVDVDVVQALMSALVVSCCSWSVVIRVTARVRGPTAGRATGTITRTKGS